MSRIVEACSYDFRHNERVVVDTNVWYYVYGPTPPRPMHEVDSYSFALRKASERGSQLILPTVIVIELLEKFMTFHLGKIPDRLRQMSKYQRRNDEYFKRARKKTVADIRTILQQASVVEPKLNSEDVGLLIDNFEKTGADVVDGLLILLCQELDVCLMSHDRDYLNSDLILLTANQSLLED